MKDVPATLRRIDEQINAHNQSIARSRLEIARLQDTRLVLMGLAEEDIIIAEQAKMERVGTINGSHAVPQLIVRKVGFGDEDGSASKAAKAGVEVNKSGDRRGMNHPRRGTKGNKTLRGPASELGKFRQRILDLLKDAPEPMASREIGNHLGVPAAEAARKPMQNALYNMRVNGMLRRDDQKRYSLRPPQ